MDNLRLEHKIDTLIRMVNILLVKQGIDVRKNFMDEYLDCPICNHPIKYNPTKNGGIERFCACSPGVYSVNINDYGTNSNKNESTSRQHTSSQ